MPIPSTGLKRMPSLPSISEEGGGRSRTDWQLALRDIYEQQILCLESFETLLRNAESHGLVDTPSETASDIGRRQPPPPTNRAVRPNAQFGNNLVPLEEGNNAMDMVRHSNEIEAHHHRPSIITQAGYGSLGVKGSIWRKILIQSMLREESDVQQDFYREHGCGCKSWTQLRYSCFRLVSRKWFEYLMGLIIVANAIVVGYEIQASLDQVAGWMYWIDFFFVMIYLVELTVRLLAWGKKCFYDPWCILDMILVAIGVLSLITDSLGFQVQELESMLVVRSFRLLRLIRALRLLKQFRTVWRLVSGLGTSANAMVSTLALVVLTLYIAACLGIEVITKDSTLMAADTTSSIVSTHFGSLFSTLLTLSSFVTLDSIAPIYAPLIEKKPSLTLYFFLIILFVSVALMNLVTAVLVEGALANASADKEVEKLDLREKLQNEMPRLLNIFEEIDKDGSGTLTMEEMSHVPIDIIPEELRQRSDIASMHDVFEMLDVDGGGELSREEFVDGLLSLFLHEVPATAVQTLRLLRSVDNKVVALAEQVQQLRHPHVQGRIHLPLPRPRPSADSSRSSSTTDLFLGSA